MINKLARLDRMSSMSQLITSNRDVPLPSVFLLLPLWNDPVDYCKLLVLVVSYLAPLHFHFFRRILLLSALFPRDICFNLLPLGL